MCLTAEIRENVSGMRGAEMDVSGKSGCWPIGSRFWNKNIKKGHVLYCLRCGI